MDFLAERPEAWQARPNVHLAFRNAPVTQRPYLNCHLEISKYIHGWSGGDFGQIGACHYNEIRETLWPWLREHQYAGPEDDQQLDAFLTRLGHRDTHLRHSIKLWRTWPWVHAVDLDERGALVAEVRNAVAELLNALDEPLPPACTDTPTITTNSLPA